MSLLLHAPAEPYAPAPRSRNIASDNLVFDLCLFFLPIIGTIRFNFIGEVLLSDLILPFFLIVALVVRGVPPRRLIYFILAASALWLVSLIISDIINNSASHDYLRGWARNGLGCGYLLAFVCTARPNQRSIGMLTAGVAALLLLACVLLTKRLDFEWFVKFGGGACVLFTLSIIAMNQFRKGKPALVISAFFLWTVVAISQNVRSNMSIGFLVGSLIAASYYGHRFFRRFSLSALFLVFVAGAGVLGAGLAASYNSLVSSGALGDAATAKYRLEDRGGTANQIWNARPELRVALAVIADSPLLGHGSWYRDPKIAAAELIFSGFIDSQNPNPDNMAKSVLSQGGQQAGGHSVILQSWVEAGILGAFFWIVVFCTCVVAILQALRRPNVLSPVLFMAAVSLCWEIAFSPFEGHQRLIDMVELTLVLTIMTASRTNQITSRRIPEV